MILDVLELVWTGLKAIGRFIIGIGRFFFWILELLDLLSLMMDVSESRQKRRRKKSST